jgi:Flp pilus assembly protein TadD
MMARGGLSRFILQVAAVSLLVTGAACSFLPRQHTLHDPLTAREHVTLGEIYAAQGHIELASKEFKTALTRNPDFAPALVGLGNLAFQAGQIETAEEHYRRALHASPEHAGAANNLAMVYLLRGERLDEAEQLARGALERSGALRPYVLETLATLYVQQRRYREAMAAVEEAERVATPDSPVLWERLGQLRKELQDRPADT